MCCCSSMQGVTAGSSNKQCRAAAGVACERRPCAFDSNSMARAHGRATSPLPERASGRRLHTYGKRRRAENSRCSSASQTCGSSARHSAWQDGEASTSGSPACGCRASSTGSCVSVGGCTACHPGIHSQGVAKCGAEDAPVKCPYQVGKGKEGCVQVCTRQSQRLSSLDKLNPTLGSTNATGAL